MIEELIIRAAEPHDVDRILELIQELADYEKAGEEVEISAEDLRHHGFSEAPSFKCILAERKDEILGLAILYDRYSTWKGRILYLEDLIVTESARGQGIGEALLKECMSMAKQGEYKRLDWQVLDWNKPAIDFYRKAGVEMDDTWINCRMRF